jgi:hypothetical protein
MGAVEFSISQAKFFRLLVFLIGAFFTVVCSFQAEYKVGAIFIGAITLVLVILSTIAVRQGNGVLKHLKANPQDAYLYDDNPLG